MSKEDKLPPPRTKEQVYEIVQEGSSLNLEGDMDYLVGQIRAALGLHPDLFVCPKDSVALKVIDIRQEGDNTAVLLSAPLDSISFTARLDEPKVSGDTKPCPACEFILDAKGECVNHRCPNWIREDLRIKE